MGILCCPVCGKPLNRTENVYTCAGRHSYDIARSGYVHLLPSNRMNTKLPGDNKQMVQARTHFLNKGYYAPLADALCEILSDSCGAAVEILDAGCGEGYYTAAAAQYLGERAHFTGIDISKNALEAAAKRTKTAEFAVGSLFHLPVMKASCDVLMTLFAPYCGEEFIRVLKKGGRMLRVIPGERHLWELKQALYDEPYLNEVKDYALDGFAFFEKREVKGRIFLPDNEDIMNLFSMTPYYYKTSQEGTKRAQELTALETQISFEILLYARI